MHTYLDQLDLASETKRQNAARKLLYIALGTYPSTYTITMSRHIMCAGVCGCCSSKREEVSHILQNNRTLYQLGAFPVFVRCWLASMKDSAVSDDNLRDSKCACAYAM